MGKATLMMIAALTASAILVGETGKAAEFTLVSESAVFNPGTSLINFTLQFNQPPDFFTVDEFDRQANSFQYFIIGQPDLHYPDNYDAIVRGEEIHITGDKLRIRSVSPSDPMPGSGGWGAIRDSAPFSVNGNTMTFSAPWNALSNHGINGNMAFHWETYEFGGFTTYGNSHTVLQPGWTVWQGGNSSGPTNWAASANWFPAGVPNGAGTKVCFGYEDAQNSVVDMISSGRTVGSLYFNAFTSTTIQSSGNYKLTLNNNGGSSTIDVEGSHAITAQVLMNNDVNITGEGVLDLSGGISGNHTLTVLSTLNATSIQVDALIIGDTGAVAVPEPAALVLLLTFAGCGLLWRRRRC
jgi:hypothetical protein